MLSDFLVFNIYNLIIYPIIYILPAYIANGAPVLFGSPPPLDLKRKIGGKRILGDGKTWKGTVSGISAGILTGIAEAHLGFPSMFVIGVALSFGALAGDILGSFLKRRFGVKPGRSTPILDQYGFYVVALIFAFQYGNLPTWYGLVFITVLTGILHPLANTVAHRLRLKKVPW